MSGVIEVHPTMTPAYPSIALLARDLAHGLNARGFATTLSIVHRFGLACQWQAALVSGMSLSDKTTARPQMLPIGRIIANGLNPWPRDLRVYPMVWPLLIHEGANGVSKNRTVFRLTGTVRGSFESIESKVYPLKCQRNQFSFLQSRKGFETKPII